MSDARTLRDKLAALAGSNDRFGPGGRSIAQAGQGETRLAILREIDTTVLLRALRFDIGGGAGAVTLVVAGRRVLGVSALDGSLATAPHTGLVGQVLASEESGQRAALTALFADIEALDTDVAVSTRETDRLGDSTEAGLSVDLLAADWGVDLGAMPLARIERVLRACGQDLHASVYRPAEGEPATTGDPELLAELQAALDASPSPQEPKVLCTGSDGSMIAILSDGKDRAAAAIYQTALTPLLAAWYTAQRQ